MLRPKLTQMAPGLRIAVGIFGVYLVGSWAMNLNRGVEDHKGH